MTRLRKDKEETDKRCAQLQKNLALAELEKEKLNAMLKVRENQVTEIKTEMAQLQDVINQQLMGMQINMPSDSFFESLTTMTGKCHLCLPGLNSLNVFYIICRCKY